LMGWERCEGTSLSPPPLAIAGGPLKQSRDDSKKLLKGTEILC
jgi:hypothetical protein